ncbi:hypothetical protein GH714_037880 [Hevea brasiliensis]|uniref:Retrotransposon gag domain-containing protein n=1 Tax=Hevea brasiliensis TaxID=3981 RepID=A0A6A6N531_HEVBR|nr:hypothetical protein GH714_037880 [Hevea brasiliensis]
MSNEGEARLVAQITQALASFGLRMPQTNSLSLGLRMQIAQITQALAKLVALQPQRECNGPRQQGRGDDDEEPRVEEGAYYQHLPRHPHGQRDNIKMKILTFRGTSSPEEYLKWVQIVDKIFEYQEYSKAKKCKLTAIEFVDYANLWWENIKAQRCRDGLDDV